MRTEMGGRHSSIDSGPASVTAPPSPFSSGPSRHSGTASQTIDALDAFDRYQEPFLTSRDYHADHRPSLHTPSTVLSSGQRRLGPRIPHRYTRNSTGGNSGDGLRSEHSLHSHSPVPPFTGPGNESGAREVFGDPFNQSENSSNPHFPSLRALSDNHIPNSVSGDHSGTNSAEPDNSDSLRTLQLLFASSALGGSSTVGSSPRSVEPSPVSPPHFVDPLGVLAPPSVSDTATAAAQSTAVRTRNSLATSGVRLVVPDERPREPRVSLAARLPLPPAARRPRPQSHSFASDAASAAPASAPALTATATSRSMFSAFRRAKAPSASSAAASSSSGAGASSSQSAAALVAGASASASGHTGRTPREQRTRRLWEALGVGVSGGGSSGGGSRSGRGHAAESSTSSEEGDEPEAGEEQMGAGAQAHPSLLPFINLQVAGTHTHTASASASSRDEARRARAPAFFRCVRPFDS